MFCGWTCQPMLLPTMAVKAVCASLAKHCYHPARNWVLLRVCPWVDVTFPKTPNSPKGRGQRVQTQSLLEVSPVPFKTSWPFVITTCNS